MRKSLTSLGLAVVAVFSLAGCNKEVVPGTVGRVQTPSGWSNDILKPGHHTCFGRDTMYLLDTTNKTFKESMNILVGGKVNLKIDFAVRVRANIEDENQLRKAFESVPAADASGVRIITTEQMYNTFLQMKAQAVPRSLFEVQPDVATAVANSPKLATEVRKQITEMAKSTPLVVEDAEITNYDWPESITKAQEALVQVQLKEAEEEARVRADLKKAEGQLKVEEANKLVELKKAEAMAEGIDVIKGKLAGSPEYLMWHQVRVMGQAAQGPNNCFILYPYSTDSEQVQRMMGNAHLSQILKTDAKESKAEATSTTLANLTF